VWNAEFLECVTQATVTKYSYALDIYCIAKGLWFHHGQRNRCTWPGIPLALLRKL